MLTKMFTVCLLRIC